MTKDVVNLMYVLYTQAYADEEKEIKEFEEKKNELISKLESKEEKELVEKGLG